MKLLAKAGFSKQTSFKKKKAVVDRGEKIQGFLMAVIPFIGFLAFTAFPLGLTIFVSFTDLLPCNGADSITTSSYSDYRCLKMR